ncbi:hypothetical protein [Cohnella endophytica]|uniref:hypothetical protein n=1 Tax=Cohnella endophytica TaxID=2419778 RepID=UPI0013144E89|nr:hypothetical protein [Cohnella endophytica]
MLIHEYATYKIWESDLRISEIRLAKMTGARKRSRVIKPFSALIVLLAHVIGIRS